MRRLLVSMITIIFVFSCASAQVRYRPRKKLNYNEHIVKKYIDTIAVIRAADSVAALGDDTNVLNNPYYYPLLLNPTLYDRSVSYAMQSPWKPSRLHETSPLLKAPEELSPDSTGLMMSNYLNWAYTNVPWLVTTTQTQVESAEGLRKDIVGQPPKKIKDITEGTNDNVDLGIEDVSYKVVTRRPNFWTFGGTFSFSMSQNYVSSNWYQGDQRNNSFGVVTELWANYNNPKGFKFENKFSTRLGFVSQHKDKYHKYATNSDKTEIVSLIGLQAFKHWYYILKVDAWTQLYPKYSSNSDNVTSDFLSPVEGNLSLGMQYTLDVKNFHLDANLAPLSYHAKYCDRDALRSSFGIRGDHHASNDFGPNFTINYKWTIAKNIVTSGKLYYYSDYHYVLGRYESTTTFQINKYLKTELYLYSIFQDNRHVDGKREFFQYRENLSLGLTFSL